MPDIDQFHSSFLFFFFGFVEATNAVKSATKLGVELSHPELELLDQICCSALKNLKDQVGITRVESEVGDLLNELIKLIENCLLPSCLIQDCVLCCSMYVSGSFCSWSTDLCYKLCWLILCVYF